MFVVSASLQGLCPESAALPRGRRETAAGRKIPSTTKFDKEPNKQAVFSLLHTPRPPTQSQKHVENG